MPKSMSHLSNGNNAEVTQEVEINELTVSTSDQQLLNQKKVSHADFDLLSVIGRGGYGKVFLVQKNNGPDVNQLYAMKVLKKARLVLHKKDSQLVISERNIMESVRHPFLVRLCYAFQCDSRLYLCMEYLPGGDLFRRMDIESTFLEKEALFYVSEIVLALCHLHSLGIIYRDLKPENVVLDAEGHVKLTDFGMCKEALGTDGRTNTFCGTAEYMAPEIIEKKGYDKAVDWWSLGIMLYFMLNGKTPFLANNEQKIYQKILKGQFFMPRHFTDSSKGFIKLLLVRNPVKRLGSGSHGSDNIKAHSVFRSVNWEATYSRQVEPPYTPSLTSNLDVSQFDPTFTQMDPVFTPDERQSFPIHVAKIEGISRPKAKPIQFAVPVQPTTIPSSLSVVKKSRYRDCQEDGPTNGLISSSSDVDFVNDLFHGFSYVAPDVLEDLATTEWLTSTSCSSRNSISSSISSIPKRKNSLSGSNAVKRQREPFINADDFMDQGDLDALTQLSSEFQTLTVGTNADCEWSFEEILDHSPISYNKQSSSNVASSSHFFPCNGRPLEYDSWTESDRSCLDKPPNLSKNLNHFTDYISSDISTFHDSTSNCLRTCFPCYASNSTMAFVPFPGEAVQSNKESGISISGANRSLDMNMNNFCGHALPNSASSPLCSTSTQLVLL